jgi:hypothetical protein
MSQDLKILAGGVIMYLVLKPLVAKYTGLAI